MDVAVGPASNHSTTRQADPAMPRRGARLRSRHRLGGRGKGFEPAVPTTSSARFVLRSEPFHGAGLWCRLTPRLARGRQLLGLELLGLPAVKFVDGVAL